MEHRDAAPLLIDHVRGRLEGESARTMESHVATCAECRGLAETIRRVDHEISAHGAALFERHPTSDDLARWALAADSLPTEILARLGGHVNACPTCRREAELARRAATPSLATALAGRARGLAGEGMGGWLKPALAVAAILLAWPAWQGLVAVPALRREVAETRAELDAARERERAVTPAPEVSGGAGRIVVLGGAMRSTGDGPAVALAEGQAVLPVLIDLESAPALLDADGQLDATLVPAGGGAAVFALRASATALRDPAMRTLTLLVPTSRLSPGAWRLELRRAGAAGAPLYAATFRITAR